MPNLAPSVFVSDAIHYESDSCEPLKASMAEGGVQVHACARSGYPGAQMSEAVLPGVCTVGYWDADRVQSWGLDWHRNEGIEITVLTNGTMPFAVGEDLHELQPDTMTITRPWQEHRVGNPTIGACRLYWLILDVSVRRPHSNWQWPSWIGLPTPLLQQLETMIIHNESAVVPNCAELAGCFRRMDRFLDQDQPVAVEARLRVLITEVLLVVYERLLDLDRELDESLSESSRTVEYFLEELPKYLQHEWTLDNMAADCELGRSQFAEHCKRITNQTPVEYLTRLRVRRAAELLTTSDEMVTAIATACGFHSPKYFSTCFRKAKALSPSQFRAQR